MAAPKGNQFWKARTSHGRDKLFETPVILWEACVEYFEWVEENPLQEAIVYQGMLNKDDAKPLMQAMTITGMCIFLDIGESTWKDYRKREGFSPVIEKAEKIIYHQKFAGAAAGLLNPNIIARDLGLVDKKENDNKVSLTDMSSAQLDAKLKALLDATNS